MASLGRPRRLSGACLPSAGRYRFIYGKQVLPLRGSFTEVVSAGAEYVRQNEAGVERVLPFSREPGIVAESPGTFQVTYYLRESGAPAPRLLHAKIIAGE